MPTPEQLQVRDKHFDSLLISKAKEIVMEDEKGNPKFLSEFCISTTKHSQALIVVDGCKDQLPRDSYSHDPYNPWLMAGYAQISKPEFFTKLNEYWENLQVPADWNICPFRVYKWSRNEWVACNSEVDHDPEKKVVRVKVRDQTFWCHPPRPFNVLKNVCGNDYKQKEGNLKTKLKSFQGADTASQSKSKTSKLKASFDKLYELVEKLEWNNLRQLTSYRYPTFQMAVNTTYTPTAPDRRSRSTSNFGAHSSGVYPANSNEAHHRFEKEGTEPIPKPTKKVFWDWVMKSLDENNPLPYESVFEEEETDN